VARQAASGVSIRQFCEQEGISQQSFYAWRRRLRPRAGLAVRSSTTGRGGEEPRTRPEFIPLSVLDTPSVWEVVHPDGCRVRISGEVNATALQCIVGVLDGRTLQ
jgi:transposase-like protein